jgi:3-hydroxymyristoyl/3-hydroxydecanoyl-(acyl carrier protein) dehydratase
LLPEVPEQLSKRAQREPLWAPTESTRKIDLGRAAIERLLPHRDPLLLLDAITLLDYKQRALAGRRRLDPADPVFAGHFPDHPVYPATLQMEAVGQLSACLIALWQAHEDGLPIEEAGVDVRVIGVERAAFLAEVGPGDELTLLSRIIEADSLAVRCAGQVMKGGSVCALATLELYLV